MARVDITVTTPGGNYDSNGNGLTTTAADATNKNQWSLKHGDLLVAYNSGASSRSVTVTSVAVNGRTQDQSVSLAAGGIHLFGPFKAEGWLQPGGYVFCEAAHAEVLFGVIRKVNP